MLNISGQRSYSIFNQSDCAHHPVETPCDVVNIYNAEPEYCMFAERAPLSTIKRTETHLMAALSRKLSCGITRVSGDDKYRSNWTCRVNSRWWVKRVRNDEANVYEFMLSVTHHRRFHRRAVHAGQQGQRTLRRKSGNQFKVTSSEEQQCWKVLERFLPFLSIYLLCSQLQLKMDWGRDTMITAWMTVIV